MTFISLLQVQVIGVSQTEMAHHIVKLQKVISDQNEFYRWMIGILFIFIAFVQLRLSQKEINKIEKDLSAKFDTKFADTDLRIDKANFSKSQFDVTTLNGWKLIGDNKPVTVYSNDSLAIIELNIQLTNENNKMAITGGSEFMVDPVSQIYDLDGLYTTQTSLKDNSVPSRNKDGKWMFGDTIVNNVSPEMIEIKQRWVREITK